MALVVKQELAEVPWNVLDLHAHIGTSVKVWALVLIHELGRLTPQEFEHLVGLPSIDLNLMEERKLDTPSILNVVFDFVISRWLLLPELVAWERQNFEAVLLISLVKVC